MDTTKAIDVLSTSLKVLSIKFKGEIIHAAVNHSGTCHDRKLASLSGLSPLFKMTARNLQDLLYKMKARL